MAPNEATPSNFSVFYARLSRQAQVHPTGFQEADHLRLKDLLMQSLTCTDCRVCSLGKLEALFQEIQYNSQGLNAICSVFHFKENSFMKMKTW